MQSHFKYFWAAGTLADFGLHIVKVDILAWNMGLSLSLYEILIPRGFRKEMCFSLEMFVLQMEMCLQTKGQLQDNNTQYFFSFRDFEEHIHHLSYILYYCDIAWH